MRSRLTSLNDDRLRSFISDLHSNAAAHDGYSLVGNQLLYKNRLVLPHSSPFTQLVFKECHDGVIGGHLGVLKTFKRVTAKVYREGMKRDILIGIGWSLASPPNSSTDLG